MNEATKAVLAIKAAIGPHAVYADEAKLMDWGDTAATTNYLKLALDPTMAPNPFKGHRKGERFYVFVIPINDDETVGQPSDTGGVAQQDERRNPPSEVAGSKPAGPAALPPRKGTIAWDAVNFCKRPDFQSWIANHPVYGAWIDEADKPVTADGAARYVRHACGVSSRGELDRNPEAAAKWRTLRDTFEIDACDPFRRSA